MQSSLNWIQIKWFWHLSQLKRSLASECLIFAKSNLSCNYSCQLTILASSRRSEIKKKIKNTAPFPLIVEQKRARLKPTWFWVYCLFWLFQVKNNIRAFQLRSHAPFSGESDILFWFKSIHILQRKLSFEEYLRLNGKRNFLELIDDINRKEGKFSSNLSN